MPKLTQNQSLRLIVELAALRGYSGAALDDALWLQGPFGDGDYSEQDVLTEMQRVHQGICERLQVIEGMIKDMTA